MKQPDLPRFLLGAGLLALLVFAGFVPVGAEDRIRMTVSKAPAGDLQLDWTDSCGSPGTDYAVYEGTLGGAFATHTSIQCSTSNTTGATITPLGGSMYYLVVPQENGAEGTYGTDSSDNERAVGTSTCLGTQAIQACLEDSFIDADPARVIRLDTVLDSAATMFVGGSSFTDVANMLALEPDVTDIHSDETTMFFTVDGLPAMLHDADAARFGGPLNDVVPPAIPFIPPPPANQLASNPVNADAVQGALPRGQRMVGMDDDGDGFRDLPKHALILAPYEFQFGTGDSAPLARTILEGVRDFQEGTVTYINNPQDFTLSTMTVSNYIDNWTDMDVIFLSTHGGQNNNAFFGPDPFIMTGIGGPSCNIVRATTKAEIPDPAMRPGLICSRVKHNNTILADTVATRQFFETVHGGNLQKKLIYFDACQTAKHHGLAEALTGMDSIFLGWSESVFTTTSIAAMDAVLRETAEDAFPVLRAVARECGGGVCKDPVVPDRPQAELLAAWHRADLRTREALNIPSTPQYFGCAESPTLPVEQTCPSCGGGFPMSILFPMTLEGLEPEDLIFLQDPLEFAYYQLRLFADLDLVESGFAQILADGFMIPLGNGEYTMPSGATLGMDNICPYQTIEYNPWVLLPAFDEAMPGNDARDRIYSWDGPFTIQIIPNQF